MSGCQHMFDNLHPATGHPDQSLSHPIFTGSSLFMESEISGRNGDACAEATFQEAQAFKGTIEDAESAVLSKLCFTIELCDKGDFSKAPKRFWRTSWVAMTKKLTSRDQSEP